MVASGRERKKPVVPTEDDLELCTWVRIIRRILSLSKRVNHRYANRLTRHNAIATIAWALPGSCHSVILRQDQVKQTSLLIDILSAANLSEVWH